MMPNANYLYKKLTTLSDGSFEIEFYFVQVAVKNFTNKLETVNAILKLREIQNYPSAIKQVLSYTQHEF